MKIIFIRHGAPDYVNDTLTEKGRREAELLSHRVVKWDVKDFYCSPLGRAKDTAAYSMDKLNRTAEEKDWLREFFYPVKDPATGQDRIAWDFMPEYWTKEPLLYDKDRCSGYADRGTDCSCIPSGLRGKCGIPYKVYG